MTTNEFETEMTAGDSTGDSTGLRRAARKVCQLRHKQQHQDAQHNQQGMAGPTLAGHWGNMTMALKVLNVIVAISIHGHSTTGPMHHEFSMGLLRHKSSSTELALAGSAPQELLVSDRSIAAHAGVVLSSIRRRRDTPATVVDGNRPLFERGPFRIL